MPSGAILRPLRKFIEQSHSLAALERLNLLSIISDDEERRLAEFVRRILDITVAVDLAATTTSMHLRDRGKTKIEHLNMLGLKSFKELEAMSLLELQALVGKKSSEVNKGLRALKFTIWNVGNDMDQGKNDSAQARMKNFIARWLPA